MKTFEITLPLSDCEEQLKELNEMLKSYEGKEVEDAFIISKKATLVSLQVRELNSHYFGYIPLVLDYKTAPHSYITSFYNLKVIIGKDKIIFEGIHPKTKESIKYEYNFI